MNELISIGNRGLDVLNRNCTLENFLELSNCYKSIFSGALFDVAFCRDKMEVLNIIVNNNEIITNFLEDASVCEEVMILSQGIHWGEKSFSIEYTSERYNRSMMLKASYTEELHHSQFPIFRLYIYDVTDLKEELENEKKSSLEFELFSESLSVGILRLGMEEGYPVYWCNENFHKNSGYTCQEMTKLFRNHYLQMVQPSDREEFCSLVEKCLKVNKTEIGRITMYNKEGKPQLYEVKVFPVKYSQKEDIEVYCILTVMTEDMKKEHEIKSLEKRYKLVLSFASEIVFEYDLEADVVHYYGGEESTLKRPACIKDFYKKVIANSLPSGKLTEESREEIKRIITMFKVNKLGSTDAYLCYQISRQKTQWVYLVAKCVFSENNEALIIVGKLSDVTVHKEVEQKLMIKANTDYLTQVSTREYAQEEIQKYLKNKNSDMLSALFIIDVDNFKHINDVYGHLEGDAVLTKLCDILRREFRDSDIIGRLGGDEFIIFMKDVATILAIYKKADTICQTVREEINHVTVSIGLSLFTENSSFQELYKTADIALYQAKIRGKNKYVCYNDLNDEMKQLEAITRTGMNVTDLSDIFDKEEFSSNVYNNFGRTIQECFDFIYAVNLTQNKVRRFNEQDYPGNEHNFRTYHEMYDHVYQEIFDLEEQLAFAQIFSRENLVKAFDEERSVHCYIRVFNQNQEFHWYFIEAVLYEIDPQNDIICTILLKDVQKSRNDEMRKYENRTKSHIIQKLEDEKSYDSLTGLYQANKFYEVSKDRLSNNVGKKHAIIFFDIDNFRVINDIYSEEVGDQIICFIAEVLCRIGIDDKVFCRYYADCFTLLINYDTRNDIIDVINWIREECAKAPYITTSFKMSFGVYLVSDPSIPIRLMCDWARLATRPIKGLANQYFAFYNEEYRKELVETQRIEAEMHHALENDEFKMYLQPKYNLRTNQVVGAEALVRWMHPKHGIIYPNKFIKLFEKNGFILQLDEYMWEQACKELRKWLDMGISYPISVNISRLHTYDPSLVHKLLSLANKYEIPVCLLELEFTEGLFMENVHMLYGLMYELKKNGFVLQMDDFGSGYSSLNMLKSVPIDVIKLDKAFFEDISGNERGKIIIEDSIKMIHNLNLEVMAEGIETKEHVDFLNKCNCIIGQGYYYAKPMPLEDFDRRLLQSIDTKSEV